MAGVETGPHEDNRPPGFYSPPQEGPPSTTGASEGGRTPGRFAVSLDSLDKSGNQTWRLVSLYNLVKWSEVVDLSIEISYVYRNHCQA